MAVGGACGKGAGRRGGIGRKGVFFTLMALLLVIFLMLYQRTGENRYTPSRADTEAAVIRTSVMNSYILTFEQHASNSLRTAGYFTLQNLSGRIRKDGQYVTDMNASVRFCMNNGTNPHNCLYANQTVSTSLSRLADMARTNLSIDTRYQIEQVWVTEERPFEVVFWMNVSYNVSDSFARWHRRQTIRADIDVTGIEDPVYAYQVGTGGLTRTRAFKEGVVKSLQFDNTSFTTHYTNEWYTYHESGRSVLQRFTGNLSQNSTCCGLESVVRSQQLPAAALGDPRLVNWSFVDYQFFQRSDPRYQYDCHTMEIAGLRYPGDFPDMYVRLDSDHLFNFYHVNGSARYGCSVS